MLIPARNEEISIGDAVLSILESRGVDFEVIVLDDASTDRTAAIVKEIAGRDSRVRLQKAPALPQGWCGKQHACFVLSQQARYDYFCFLDADVRLQADALAVLASHCESGRFGLVSGFPRQETVTFLERLLIPLIHFVLLAYMPFDGMRWFRRVPAFAAGCGQLMLLTRQAYEASGGHSSIRRSLHDGIRLPQAIRRAGFSSDCVDAGALASCRMYRSSGEVWRGLGKNATEGMASPGRILPFTFLLLIGQVLPFALGMPWTILIVYVPRLIAVVRFQQPLGAALLHPLGVLLLLVIQWQALLRALSGKPSKWKDRTYAVAGQS